MKAEYKYIGRSWARIDVNREGYKELTWCTGTSDTSRDTRGIHGNSEGSEYNSDCGWCFLGAAHTIDEHNSELAEHAARHQKWADDCAAAGCGKMIRVAGTNGGRMPCGAILNSFGTKAPYYCADCTDKLAVRA